MRMIKIFVIALLPAFMLLQACKNNTKRDEVKEEYREAGQATEEYFEQERDSAVKNMRQQKAKIDARLEKMRAEARAAKGDAKRKAQEQIDRLDSLSKRTGDKIEEARAASRQKWAEMKTDMKETANEIEAEWNDLVTDDDQQ